MHQTFRTLLLTGIAAGTLALAGCAVQPPSSTILSRLPEPGAAGGQPPTLSSAERKRYDEIDRQAMREQHEAMAAEAAARAWANYTPPPVNFYGGYSSGGWGNRWGTGVTYGYPGWWW
ncbi:hypothetical protein QZM46_28640 [Burkholderia vietnamiensis]|jgi:outer membrane murein-binding lipoprotein Lpp|uniref:Lipoprotein n=2 Tax=Burkholderia vietnamiensis TaxID=60552 RepID=A4JFY3_BURVG|nr:MULTISPECIES: hypothetical protein [Burkholderia]ABO55186.1 conserved hypothetical protein [Burkholderia vietnamiensis G4]AFJ86249.1 hypothetical protein MYA_1888 [Burkholderia sp. KJ006]AJY06093.1 hypothetical protein AK36_1783 [Burkholderia vietnamiensis LMG 10929]AOK01917.1 hypothetical protein WK23_19730 [Burkholderia vietnamiensis]AOK10535.1 hypothetical protein WK31_09970 [Burkholderia vietnamiensis]